MIIQMSLDLKRKKILLAYRLVRWLFVCLKRLLNVTLWPRKYFEFFWFNQVIECRHLFQVLLEVVPSLIYKFRLHIITHPSFAWQLRNWNAWPVLLKLFMQGSKLLKPSLTSPRSFWIDATALVNNMISTKFRINDAKLVFFCVFENVICVLEHLVV